MYHKTRSTNIPCSSPIKKTTGVSDHRARANNSSFFLLFRDRIHMHEIINLFKKSVNRGQFIIKNALIPLFPNTPKKESELLALVPWSVTHVAFLMGLLQEILVVLDLWFIWMLHISQTFSWAVAVAQILDLSYWHYGLFWGSTSWWEYPCTLYLVTLLSLSLG